MLLFNGIRKINYGRMDTMIFKRKRNVFTDEAWKCDLLRGLVGGIILVGLMFLAVLKIFELMVG